MTDYPRITRKDMYNSHVRACQKCFDPYHLCSDGTVLHNGAVDEHIANLKREN